VLCGVEISAADWMGRKAHILGYRLQKPSLVDELTGPCWRRATATAKNRWRF
jgi:hypothetical protein